MITDKYKCRNFNKCGNMIVFTERDNEFFVQKGWVDEDGRVQKPKYCKPCRLERKGKPKYNG